MSGEGLLTAGIGPTPTTSAVQKVVSYLSYCGRAAHLTGTAALTSTRTRSRSERTAHDGAETGGSAGTVPPSTNLSQIPDK